MATFRGTVVSFDAGTHTATVRLDGSAAQTLPDLAVSRGIAAADVDAGDRCLIDTGDHNNPLDFVVAAVFTT